MYKQNKQTRDARREAGQDARREAGQDAGRDGKDWRDFLSNSNLETTLSKVISQIFATNIFKKTS